MSLEPAADNDPVPRARDLFERASAGLDHGMASRLRRARREALAPTRRRPAGPLVPAAALAVGMLAIAIAWWAPTRAPVAPPAPPVAEADAIERLLAGEEDPEMYAWLAEAPVATSDRSGR